MITMKTTRRTRRTLKILTIILRKAKGNILKRTNSYNKQVVNEKGNKGRK